MEQAVVAVEQLNCLSMMMAEQLQNRAQHMQEHLVEQVAVR